MTESEIEVRQGKTFSKTLRWGAKPFLYKAITDIDQVAPVLITVPIHGLPDGWPAAVVSVKGMTEINALKGGKDFVKDYNKITLEDANTISINDINAAEYSVYTSGGYVMALTPVDLAGYSARFVIKDRIGGTVLATIDEADGIDIDNTAKTITLTIAASATDDWTFKSGVFELEMESSGGQVTTIYAGTIAVIPEVAT
jgi:hypothetical protein